MSKTKGKLPFVVIYTDGACNMKHNAGAWGSFLSHGNHELMMCGFVKNTTNNQMELQSVISALEKLNTPCQVIVYTDSQYVVNGINKWIYGWVKKNWINSKGEPVANQDRWKKIYELCRIHKVKAEWVKGHNGDPGNTLCDELALTVQFLEGGYKRTNK